ncbi:MAG TPA: hypothetical protein VFR21_20895 [Bradyrhizobium sp.]|jgi:hypothetical protein|nr:hypothetical protein [Bradyrhizobium sp.]
MSVSSISTTPSAPPPPYTDSSASSSSQRANEQQQSPGLKADKDGDEVAAAQQQTARAPLPPGQGTRVDILV